MARQALPVSPSLAALLRDRRQQMNLTLREVEDRSRGFGVPIPFTTLGKVERGVVDPGLLRLNSLCKIYGISLELAGDVMDLEGGGVTVDEREATELMDDAADAWKQGDLRKAVSDLAALRLRTDLPRVERQRALLHFSILAGSLGRYKIAQSVVEDLLLEPPEPELLVRVLVQAAVCWHRRGCATGRAFMSFAGPCRHFPTIRTSLQTCRNFVVWRMPANGSTDSFQTRTRHARFARSIPILDLRPGWKRGLLMLSVSAAFVGFLVIFMVWATAWTAAFG